MVSVTKHLPDEFYSELARRRRRHAMEIMLVCFTGLIPWTIYLALTLPGDYRAHYWRLSWAGFDVVLLAAMALTAYLGWRGRLTVIVGAVATATLLICDAWFDVVLDLGTRDVWTSLGSAVFFELPLAGFFLRRAYLIMQLALARAQDFAPVSINAPASTSTPASFPASIPTTASISASAPVALPAPVVPPAALVEAPSAQARQLVHEFEREFDRDLKREPWYRACR